MYSLKFMVRVGLEHGSFCMIQAQKRRPNQESLQLALNVFAKRFK